MKIIFDTHHTIHVTPEIKDDLFMLKNIVIIVFLLLSTGCSSPEKSYSAAPVGGRVIDKETLKPIEGAYVVAVYVLDIGMEGGSRTPLHYEETRTDREGRFHFNGFKKKKIPYERATSNEQRATQY